MGLLTREYPPDVTGGAGAHVEFLARELRALADLEVHCWGDGEAEGVLRHRPAASLAGADPALGALSVDLAMAAELAGRELVHSHTWYASLAGHLAKLLYGVPHVITVHSLTPAPHPRPPGVDTFAGWAERTAIGAADAVVTLSRRMRQDILAAHPALDPARVRVIPGGVDTLLFRPDHETDALERTGVDPTRPYALFVGRLTGHKGLPHLLRAAHALDPEAQLVLCTGPPGDTPADAEARELIAELDRVRDGVRWIPGTLPRPRLVQLLSHATVLVCPSVREPLGMINLEAMACGTAVVASAVGGIPEVVDDGTTGLLVPYDARHPEAFESGLTQALNRVLDDPGEAARMGAAGRRRVVREFVWERAARRVHALYGELLAHT
ncbi:glycogen synthase [Streptomyces amakusaensis]|uniref:Glycogen synthase n=1 Tax=Streptomyces amakusaensis TaxID=67271 RepID=A0ABW0AKB0_9ACTN